MKYLLSILVLFSGLSFSISEDELKERYKNVNEEDTLLVCDTNETNPDLTLRTLFTISKKSDYANSEFYDYSGIALKALLVKIRKGENRYRIGDYISIDRFTLEMKYLENTLQCRIVDRFGYLVARNEVTLMADSIRAKRKI